MSEEAETPIETADEPPKKKKSKLPIILVLVLVLGGGGFFAMKMRGGGKAKPEIKLSKEKPAELKEFLVNLRDQGVYCRTEIAFGLAEGAKPTVIDDHEAAVRDAINLRITSKKLSDVNTVEGLMQLKRDIATDVNKILAEPTEEQKPDDANADGTDDATPPKKDAKDPKAESDKPTAPVHPDWDSDTGPVLKVYFNSFATQ